MANEKIALTPFRFMGCMELKEMLGLKARDEEDLMIFMEEVPLESIYYHVYSYLLRHNYLLGAYPNDFASWVHLEVRDSVMAEKLGLLDPFEYENLEDLRVKIVELISDHLDQIHGIPAATMGHHFFFMKSHIIEVPTKIEVKTLREFREALNMVDSSVIFNHFFAATEKLQRRMDFVEWIETELQLEDLARDLRLINPYMMSLEKLRGKLQKTCDKYLPRPNRKKSN